MTHLSSLRLWVNINRLHLLRNLSVISLIKRSLSSTLRIRQLRILVFFASILSSWSLLLYISWLRQLRISQTWPKSSVIIIIVLRSIDVILRTFCPVNRNIIDVGKAVILTSFNGYHGLIRVNLKRVVLLYGVFLFLDFNWTRLIQIWF